VQLAVQQRQGGSRHGWLVGCHMSEPAGTTGCTSLLYHLSFTHDCWMRLLSPAPGTMSLLQQKPLQQGPCTTSSRQQQQPGSRTRRPVVAVRAQAAAAAPTTAQEPLMVRAARGEEVERAPCWMMRQAGR
jgi:hypothetical protein